MRSTVTLRDELVEAADRVAARLGVSRSRLVEIALEAYLRGVEEDQDVLTKQMNLVVAHAGEPSDEASRQRTAHAWKQSMGDGDDGW